MRNTIQAGLIYFAMVFSLAFVLGVLRVTLIAPKLGAVVAVALELPLVLAASWRASAYATRRGHIAPAQGKARLQMGVLAFGVLMGVELAMAVVIFKQSAHEFLAAMLTPHGLLGLAGQMAFGLIPWIQGAKAKTRR